MNLPNVSVEESLIHGRGLFAGQIIDEGVRIIEYVGDIVTMIEERERRIQYRAQGIRANYFMELVYHESSIDATINGNDSRFANHSCEPNCYFEIVHESGVHQIWITSLRKILEGEEITVDYELNDGSKCMCKSPKCSGFL